MAILPDRSALTTPADGDLYVTTDVSDTTDAATGTDKKITWSNIKAGLKTYFDTLYQDILAEGAFVDGDKTKLDGIETAADVTDATNVTAAGALMDSECTSLADVKALDQSVISGASPTFTTTNFTDATNKRLLTDAQEALVDGSMQDLVDDTTPTLGGELDAGANSIGFTMQTATGDGTTTIDWKLGNHFDFTFGAFNETFTFTPPSKPGVYTLSLKQDSVGSRTATWPGTVKWPGGSPPTLTTTATTGYDIISFRYDGSNYYGVSTLNFS